MSYEDLIAALENRITTLHDMAYDIASAHFKLIKDGEAKMPGWENRSTLHLRCAKKGNSIRIDWCNVKWYGPKGSRSMMRKPIPKPRGKHEYALGKLYAYAKDWEKPLIEDTEKQMAVIRQEASHLVKALTYLRYAEMANAKRAEGSSN